MCHDGGRIVKDAVILEKGQDGYGAYVPDLPGCVAVGETEAEVNQLIAEAIPLHAESLREDGLPVPEPTSQCEYIEI
jgi:predicted RNase H-like HicB family nuclease